MSFILVPKHGPDTQVNGWNWRPTLELLRAEGLLDEDLFQRMGAQGCGAEADAELARRIADVVQAKLATMKPRERMLPDLTAAPEPELKRAGPYSATYEWLATFRDFCRCSGGFKVV